MPSFDTPSDETKKRMDSRGHLIKNFKRGYRQFSFYYNNLFNPHI